MQKGALFMVFSLAYYLELQNVITLRLDWWFCPCKSDLCSIPICTLFEKYQIFSMKL